MEGNIVVDGVLASCYASVDHDMVHILLAPMRWFPGFVRNIIGNDELASAGMAIAWWSFPDQQFYSKIDQM